MFKNVIDKLFPSLGAHTYPDPPMLSLEMRKAGLTWRLFGQEWKMVCGFCGDNCGHCGMTSAVGGTALSASANLEQRARNAEGSGDA